MKKLLMKPLKALASPGIYLFGKYNQYKRERQESNVAVHPAEKELSQLNTKIDKLLSKLNGKYAEVATSPDEECVICVNAKAVMQTYPCGHKVVCRRCFVKTIQMALAQRTLLLRCVICRTKILRLRQTQHSRLPTTCSSYHSYSCTATASKRSSLWSNKSYSFTNNPWPGGFKYSKSLPGICGNSLKYKSSVNRSYSTVVYRKSMSRCCRSCCLTSHSSAKRYSQNLPVHPSDYKQSTIKREEEDMSPSQEVAEESLTRRKHSGSLSREELIHQFQREFREGQISARPVPSRKESIRMKSFSCNQPGLESPPRQTIPLMPNNKDVAKSPANYEDGYLSLEKRNYVTNMNTCVDTNNKY